MMKVILCLGSQCDKVMNNELGVGRKTRALGSKTFCNNSDTRKMKICFNIVNGKKEQSPSIFSRKCWKIW